MTQHTPDPVGDAAVDAALARLAESAGAPLRERVDLFERVHSELRSRLDED